MTPPVQGLRLLPVGTGAVLVEVADGPAALALFDALNDALIDVRLREVVELVPAARTVLVRYRPGRGAAARIIATIRSLTVRTGSRAAGELVEIPVVYDGEDLDEVAALTGLSAAEVVARHSAPTYDVAFTGFAPGFAYLAGGDPVLEVPRRPTPRTAIPAGAVGIAGLFSGVYPRRSPGGWQLLGRTATPMWDLDRTPPAMLQPGMRVRFVPAEVSGPTGVSESRRGSCMTTPTDAVAMREDRRDPISLEVLAAGGLSLIEDLGRPGLGALGVSASGALDRAAFRRANRLVGNGADAAAIEHVGGGLELRARGSVLLAVTGASGRLWTKWPDADDDPHRTEVERDRPLLLHDGEVLVVGPAETGVVTYVGVLGGFDVPRVLGSRSADVLSGLGPAPLRAGSVLPVGNATRGAVSGAPEHGPGLPSGIPTGTTTGGSDHGTGPGTEAPSGTPAGPGTRSVVTVDVTLGPRDDWFTPAAVAAMGHTVWIVTPQSNRVGMRLAGPPLERSVSRELPSEATVAGAVQIPADGQPVVFLADHPVTGGYPVIAVVVPEHLGRVAQCPAGTRLRFRVVPG
ncbi:5-oxoprolinase/urea amidolyase family protein [Curtobacterium sp. Leaf261]|uniref:5-oxoprolinase subunit B/C family protein n=1 Tax=Curtobacterium sp. Leaf261 TaxID=1736311 RepID=UPI001F2B1284|nr:5-oxoprolinase/urea amidolyase family protein [Curtobacterium sp. Leaf261]